MNFATKREVKPDSFSACVIIKVINTKYTTQFPRLPLMAPFNVVAPVLDSNTTASIAGHTVSTADSRITVAINTPITRIPAVVIGAGAGITQKIATIRKQIAIFTSFARSILNFCVILTPPNIPCFYIFSFGRSHSQNFQYGALTRSRYASMSTPRQS